MGSEHSVEEQRYERLLARYLTFYEELRTRKRRPTSAKQRHFQDVAWGKADPVTEHEHAYVFHLRRTKTGPFAVRAPLPHVDDVMNDYPVGARPVSSELGTKWDNAWRETKDGREY